LVISLIVVGFLSWVICKNNLLLINTKTSSNVFISPDPVTGKHIYSTDKIRFSVNPKKFGVSYQIDDGLSVRSTLQKTTSIKITNPDNNTSISIFLNLDGLGGSCPNYPEDYALIPIVLDGKSVDKAQYINKDTVNKNWPLGDIYFVDGNNCPNVAGINSKKNGFVTIKYNMNNIPMSSEKYVSSVKDFDEVITSIKEFWN